MEEFLTVEEIATRLKVTKKTVYDWMKAGNLRYVQVGLRSRRVPVSAFRKFLEEREHGLGESTFGRQMCRILGSIGGRY